MQKFVNLFLPGAVSGGIYAIMAAALVLTYQTSGIFNFAQGAVAFVTAYFFYQLNHGQGIPVIPAALISVAIFAPLLGFALDRILLRRLAAAPVYARIVGTIGLLIALPALALWLVEALGNTVLDLGLPSSSGSATASLVARGLGPDPRLVWHLDWLSHGVNLNSDQVAVFVAAAVTAFVLWFVLRHTRLGLQMRAVVDRDELAALRGVNSARTSSAAWMMSMVLAGLGGILIGPLFELSDSQFTLIVLGSLAAVAFAGLRSIPLAFAGGLLLGVLQNLVSGYSDTLLPPFINELAGLRSAIPFFLTIVLLFVVGRNRVGEYHSIKESPRPDHREGLPRWRRLLPWAFGVVVFVAFALQWLPWGWARADDFEALGILAPGLALAIVFLSFVVVTGMGGIVSLAQATFVTAGGLMAGWALNYDFGINLPFVASHGRLNFVVAAALGTLVAGLLGALIAIPVRRLGVLPLALASLMLALAFDLTVFQAQGASNGQLGWTYPLPKLNVFGITTFDFSQPRTEIVMLLIVFGALTLAIHNFQHSNSGRAVLAVRSSQRAAQASGISAAKSQILVFAVAAGIAGFGGVLLGMTSGFVSNTTATPMTGLLWLSAVVTFGIRRPGGALLAGLSVVATVPLFNWLFGWSFMPSTLTELWGSPYFLSIVFGLGAINLARNPDGLFALVGHQRLERRRRRERAARIELAEAELHEQSVAANGSSSLDRLGLISSSLVADDAALSVENVVAGYGDVEVLHGITLQLAKRKVTALLGANGAGKSTLCAVIAGLVMPTSGHVVMDSADVTQLVAYQRGTRRTDARAGVARCVPRSDRRGEPRDLAADRL